MQLREHQGKMLTEAEIKLTEYFAEKDKIFREAGEAQKAMRMRLAQSARAVVASASATVAAIEAAHETSKQPPSNPIYSTASSSVGAQLSLEREDSSQLSGQKRKTPEIDSQTSAKKEFDIDVDSDDDLVQPVKKATIESGTRIKKAQAIEEADDDDDEVSVDGTERLFSHGGILLETVWNARTASEKLEVQLPDFNFTKKQTLAVQLKVPLNSPHWSLNITPADDRFGSDILMHFNPRYSKSTLILNDKQGTWGFGVKRNLGQNSTTDGLRAREVTLVIQLRPDGFYIFANDMYNSFFPHRRDPEQYDALKVVFNSIDDNGNAQEVTINKVWWGHRSHSKYQVPTTASEIIEGIKAKQKETEASIVPMVKRTLVIEGLPKGISDLRILQALEFNLYKAFEEFHPESIVLVPVQGFGFVKFRSLEDIGPALEEMNGAIVQGNDEGSEYELTLSHMQS